MLPAGFTEERAHRIEDIVNERTRVPKIGKFLEKSIAFLLVFFCLSGGGLKYVTIHKTVHSYLSCRN
jgi:hypothetical protein